MSNNNKYTYTNTAIIPSEGTMFNEATTFNNNHYNRPTVNNDTTNQIVNRPIRIKRSGRKK